MIHEITMVREPSLALRALHRRHLYAKDIMVATPKKQCKEW
jgi:hypothetical protein